MSNEQLPTLPDWATAPDDAEYFAIDSDGEAMYFETEPCVFAEIFWDNGFGEKSWQCPGKFDATNWQNSLQKRPENV